MPLNKENDISNDKGEDNNYIIECPPTARDYGIKNLKNVKCDKNVESPTNTNTKTYMVSTSSHACGEETINLKIDQPIIIRSVKKTLKRKADETPASLYPTKKHKIRVKEYITKINDQSLFITPTTPALSIPPDAISFDEQADTNQPHNIFAIPPPIKRLVDTGNDVEEVTNAIFTEHLETVELDVPCLQEEKVNRGTTEKVINIQNNTYIDEDGKCLGMTDGRDQVEIKRVVRKSIREPETKGKHDGGSLESEGSENVTINTNSEAVTDRADHTTDIADLAKLKRTGHFNKITTSELRINSNNINIEERPVQSDRRCKKNTVQETKFQPDQKVPKNKMPKNKTTIQKPRKEKQFEDDNAKLGLAMKTWLEKTRSSK